MGTKICHQYLLFLQSGVSVPSLLIESTDSMICFILPLIGHWLQGCSNWWIFSWLNKIKPFMDSYHAPYRKHIHYWTGLFLTFAINANGSESIYLVAISSVNFAILAIQKRVCEHRWKNLLELFYSQLGNFFSGNILS